MWFFLHYVALCFLCTFIPSESATLTGKARGLDTGGPMFKTRLDLCSKRGKKTTKIKRNKDERDECDRDPPTYYFSFISFCANQLQP